VVRNFQQFAGRAMPRRSRVNPTFVLLIELPRLRGSDSRLRNRFARSLPLPLRKSVV
jgi:hypothetical protein